MGDGDAAAAVERIRTALQEFEKMPARADSAYRHAVGKVDDASEILGVLVEPLRMAIVRVKKMIDDTIREIDTGLGRGGLAAMFNGGSLASTFTVGDGAGGTTGSPGAGGFRGAGSTSGGPGGPDLLDQLMDGLDALAELKRYDDHWLRIRNQAATVAGRIEPAEKRLSRYWDGPAAKSYYGIVGDQGRAARQVGELAVKIATTMQTMSEYGDYFYGAVATFIVAMIGFLAAAISALFGVVTAPAAIGFLVGALTAFVAITQAYVIFFDKQDALGGVLEAEAGNPTGFDPGPSWPKASNLSTDVDPNDKDKKADWIPVRPTH